MELQNELKESLTVLQTSVTELKSKISQVSGEAQKAVLSILDLEQPIKTLQKQLSKEETPEAKLLSKPVTELATLVSQVAENPQQVIPKDQKQEIQNAVTAIKMSIEQNVLPSVAKQPKVVTQSWEKLLATMTDMNKNFGAEEVKPTELQNELKESLTVLQTSVTELKSKISQVSGEAQKAVLSILDLEQPIKTLQKQLSKEDTPEAKLLSKPVTELATLVSQVAENPKQVIPKDQKQEIQKAVTAIKMSIEQNVLPSVAKQPKVVTQSWEKLLATMTDIEQKLLAAEEVKPMELQNELKESLTVLQTSVTELKSKISQVSGEAQKAVLSILDLEQPIKTLQKQLSKEETPEAKLLSKPVTELATLVSQVAENPQQVIPKDQKQEIQNAVTAIKMSIEQNTSVTELKSKISQVSGEAQKAVLSILDLEQPIKTLQKQLSKEETPEAKLLSKPVTELATLVSQVAENPKQVIPKDQKQEIQKAVTAIKMSIEQNVLPSVAKQPKVVTQSWEKLLATMTDIEQKLSAAEEVKPMELQNELKESLTVLQTSVTELKSKISQVSGEAQKAVLSILDLEQPIKTLQKQLSKEETPEAKLLSKPVTELATLVSQVAENPQQVIPKDQKQEIQNAVTAIKMSIEQNVLPSVAKQPKVVTQSWEKLLATMTDIEQKLSAAEEVKPTELQNELKESFTVLQTSVTELKSKISQVSGEAQQAVLSILDLEQPIKTLQKQLSKEETAETKLLSKPVTELATLVSQVAENPQQVIPKDQKQEIQNAVTAIKMSIEQNVLPSVVKQPKVVTQSWEKLLATMSDIEQKLSAAEEVKPTKLQNELKESLTVLQTSVTELKSKISQVSGEAQKAVLSILDLEQPIKTLQKQLSKEETPEAKLLSKPVTELATLVSQVAENPQQVIPKDQKQEIQNAVTAIKMSIEQNVLPSVAKQPKVVTQSWEKLLATMTDIEQKLSAAEEVKPTELQNELKESLTVLQTSVTELKSKISQVSGEAQKAVLSILDLEQPIKTLQKQLSKEETPEAKLLSKPVTELATLVSQVAENPQQVIPKDQKQEIQNAVTAIKIYEQKLSAAEEVKPTKLQNELKESLTVLQTSVTELKSKISQVSGEAQKAVLSILDLEQPIKTLQKQLSKEETPEAKLLSKPVTELATLVSQVAENPQQVIPKDQKQEIQNAVTAIKMSIEQNVLPSVVKQPKVVTQSWEKLLATMSDIEQKLSAAEEVKPTELQNELKESLTVLQTSVTELKSKISQVSGAAQKAVLSILDLEQPIKTLQKQLSKVETPEAKLLSKPVTELATLVSQVAENPQQVIPKDQKQEIQNAVTAIKMSIEQNVLPSVAKQPKVVTQSWEKLLATMTDIEQKVSAAEEVKPTELQNELKESLTVLQTSVTELKSKISQVSGEAQKAVLSILDLEQPIKTLQKQLSKEDTPEAKLLSKPVTELATLVSQVAENPQQVIPKDQKQEIQNAVTAIKMSIEQNVLPSVAKQPKVVTQSWEKLLATMTDIEQKVSAAEEVKPTELQNELKESLTVLQTSVTELKSKISQVSGEAQKAVLSILNLEQPIKTLQKQLSKEETPEAKLLSKPVTELATLVSQVAENPQQVIPKDQKQEIQNAVTAIKMSIEQNVLPSVAKQPKVVTQSWEKLLATMTDIEQKLLAAEEVKPTELQNELKESLTVLQTSVTELKSKISQVSGEAQKAVLSILDLEQPIKTLQKQLSKEETPEAKLLSKPVTELATLVSQVAENPQQVIPKDQKQEIQNVVAAIKMSIEENVLPSVAKQPKVVTQSWEKLLATMTHIEQKLSAAEEVKPTKLQNELKESLTVLQTSVTELKSKISQVSGEAQKAVLSILNLEQPIKTLQKQLSKEETPEAKLLSKPVTELATLVSQVAENPQQVIPKDQKQEIQNAVTAIKMSIEQNVLPSVAKQPKVVTQSWEKLLATMTDIEQKLSAAEEVKPMELQNELKESLTVLQTSVTELKSKISQVSGEAQKAVLSILDLEQPIKTLRKHLFAIEKSIILNETPDILTENSRTLKSLDVSFEDLATILKEVPVVNQLGIIAKPELSNILEISEEVKKNPSRYCIFESTTEPLAEVADCINDILISDEQNPFKIFKNDLKKTIAMFNEQGISKNVITYLQQPLKSLEQTLSDTCRTPKHKEMDELLKQFVSNLTTLLTSGSNAEILEESAHKLEDVTQKTLLSVKGNSKTMCLENPFQDVLKAVSTIKTNNVLQSKEPLVKFQNDLRAIRAQTENFETFTQYGIICLLDLLEPLEMLDQMPLKVLVHICKPLKEMSATVASVLQEPQLIQTEMPKICQGLRLLTLTSEKLTIDAKEQKVLSIPLQPLEQLTSVATLIENKIESTRMMKKCVENLQLKIRFLQKQLEDFPQPLTANLVNSLKTFENNLSDIKDFVLINPLINFANVCEAMEQIKNVETLINNFTGFERGLSDVVIALKDVSNPDQSLKTLITNTDAIKKSLAQTLEAAEKLRLLEESVDKLQKVQVKKLDDSLQALVETHAAFEDLCKTADFGKEIAEKVVKYIEEVNMKIPKMLKLSKPQILSAIEKVRSLIDKCVVAQVPSIQIMVQPLRALLDNMTELSKSKPRRDVEVAKSLTLAITPLITAVNEADQRGFPKKFDNLSTSLRTLEKLLLAFKRDDDQDDLTEKDASLLKDLEKPLMMLTDIFCNNFDKSVLSKGIENLRLKIDEIVHTSSSKNTFESVVLQLLNVNKSLIQIQEIINRRDLKLVAELNQPILKFLNDKKSKEVVQLEKPFNELITVFESLKNEVIDCDDISVESARTLENAVKSLSVILTAISSPKNRENLITSTQNLGQVMTSAITELPKQIFAHLKKPLTNLTSQLTEMQQQLENVKELSQLNQAISKVCKNLNALKKEEKQFLIALDKPLTNFKQQLTLLENSPVMIPLGVATHFKSLSETMSEFSNLILKLEKSPEKLDIFEILNTLNNEANGVSHIQMLQDALENLGKETKITQQKLIHKEIKLSKDDASSLAELKQSLKLLQNSSLDSTKDYQNQLSNTKTNIEKMSSKFINNSEAFRQTFEEFAKIIPEKKFMNIFIGALKLTDLKIDFCINPSSVGDKMDLYISTLEELNKDFSKLPSKYSKQSLDINDLVCGLSVLEHVVHYLANCNLPQRKIETINEVDKAAVNDEDHQEIKKEVNGNESHLPVEGDDDSNKKEQITEVKEYEKKRRRSSIKDKSDDEVKDRKIKKKQKSPTKTKESITNTESHVELEEKTKDYRELQESFGKPYFVTKLNDINVSDITRIKLTCAALGSEPLEVKWFKDGSPILDNEKYKIYSSDSLFSLEVLNTSVKDSAEYTCIVNNKYGYCSTKSNLTVMKGFEATVLPPTFTRPITEAYDIDKDELTLECHVRAQPSPIITWFKNRSKLQSDDRCMTHYLADGICRLVIKRPTKLDSGLYVCKAEDAEFKDQISHQVEFEGSAQNVVKHSPHESQGLQTVSRPVLSGVLTHNFVPSGGTWALQVEVKGSPMVVTWYKDDQALPRVSTRHKTFNESGVYSLMFDNATDIDSGKYIFSASNLYGHIQTSAFLHVVDPYSIRGGKPPIFKSRPEKVLSVRTGDDIVVSFRISGDPKPRVTWMKGLQEITNDYRSMSETLDDYTRLTLKRAREEDMGTYCILAKNRYGCDRAFFTVYLRERPTSSDTDSCQNILQNIANYHERRYFTDVSGPIFGEPVVTNSGRNWLSLSWNKPQHRGAAPVIAYRVDIWLPGGEGARWKQLGITSSTNFDVFNLCPNGEYQFRITPKNRYGWGESVQTDLITLGDCAGFPEFNENLPGQIKGLLGADLTIQCKVKEEPDLWIKWCHNGKEVRVENNSRYNTLYEENTCTLIIRNLEESDSGSFMCEASNKIGRASTFTRLYIVDDPKILKADTDLKFLQVNVTTAEAPPQFLMRLRDRRVEISYPVRLTCQIAGHPLPDIEWSRDGHKISEDYRHKFLQENYFYTLEIEKTTFEDSGTYTVTAKNIFGSISCHCKLIVDKGIKAYVVPEFSAKLDPEIINVSEGGELLLLARVKAYPAVTVLWYRNGVRLRPNRKTTMSLTHDGRIQFSLKETKLEDAGVYTCIATNEVGRCETCVKVEVAKKVAVCENGESLSEIRRDIPYSKEPKFLKKPRSSDACEGDNIIICCEVIGDPKPEVIWLRDFLKPDYYKDSPHFLRIGDGPEYRLEIPEAKLDFTGTYTVIAKNCYGEAKAIISLQIKVQGIDQGTECKNQKIFGKVQTIPKIIRELCDIRCCDGDSVTLECEVDKSLSQDVRWEKCNKLVRLGGDFVSEFDGSIARLLIKKVYPEDEGEYTCVVYNDLGDARTSACLLVDVPEEKDNLLTEALSRPVDISQKSSRSPHSLSPNSYSGYNFSRASNVREVVPKFYSVPHHRIAEEGETVRFRCSIAGHPEPWTVWTKDGCAVTPSSRIIIKEQGDLRILEISDVVSQDSGLYCVTLENSVGKADAVARLDVTSYKKYLTPALRTRSASPRPSYRKYSGGDLSYGNSNGKSERQSYTGFYTPHYKLCLNAVNLIYAYAMCAQKDDNDSEWGTLSFVERLPEFVKSVEGKPIQLKVRVAGAKSFDAHWFKENHLLPNCKDFEQFVCAGWAILNISDVFIEDCGVYSCEVEDEDDVSTLHILDVTHLDSGQVSCSAYLASEEISRRSPQSSEENSFSNVDNENALWTINHVTELKVLDDNSFGSECNDSDLSSSAASDTMSNEENKAIEAVLLKGPKDTNALVGDRVLLKAAYTGDPEPSITWTKAVSVYYPIN
ncbi:hypothetical protein FQR65_LT04741 [Abscondita terminalis]|nr:hypothetical protein FQR65_LT04741 [Abscondita terminalis]